MRAEMTFETWIAAPIGRQTAADSQWALVKRDDSAVSARPPRKIKGEKAGEGKRTASVKVASVFVGR
ncbi:unnamed protein product, partial [Iphiclides podalirius]